MQDKASVIRFAVTGAMTLIILFVLCWLGAAIWPAAFTHAYIALFTSAPMTSWLALGQGVCSALLFGFFAGAVLAWSYNSSSRFGRTSG
jgi:hypothetical protein